MEGKVKVLYLDDEPGNVTGFKASFRRLFDVSGFTDPMEALEEASKGVYHVVVADQRMPGLSGVDFFEKLVKRNPEPIRVLLTAYSDNIETIDAINRGQIFRYIRKPWREDEVLEAVHNSYEVYLQRLEVKQKNDELQKAYDALSRFVYSASHDMRAPLMSVLGVIKVARQDEVPNHMFPYLDMIERSINQLSHFNSQLIDYYTNSRGDSNGVSVDLKQLVLNLYEEYQFFPGAQDIRFTLNCEEDVVFEGDSFRLRIVLHNLINNAIKFHKEDGDDRFLEITIRFEQGNLRLTVRDNGQGMEEMHLERIFEMFYRGTRKNSGSGIGLYIVKEAIEKMNGTIRVESKMGEGTCFIIEVLNVKIL